NFLMLFFQRHRRRSGWCCLLRKSRNRQQQQQTGRKHASDLSGTNAAHLKKPEENAAIIHQNSNTDPLRSLSYSGESITKIIRVKIRL
ncbi:hypothetical protein NSP53_23195, partial [Salmonella enterica]|nr:hypothetical protein [Salmonella enterica]